MAVHMIVTGANELFTLSSPESRGTSTWIKLGPWWIGWALWAACGQRVGMVGSGRMALMEAPAHTYSLLR